MSKSAGFLYFPESRGVTAGRDLLVKIDNFLWSLGSGEMTARSLANQIQSKQDDVETVLKQYSKIGFLAQRLGRPCLNDNCPVGVIWEDEFDGDWCPNCDAELDDAWRKKPPETHFEIDRGGRRFSPWLILIHGMNSPGKWQQRIAFLQGLANETSPFFIYKYGIKRVEPLVGILQDRRVRDFLQDYHNVRGDARKRGIEEPPDVVAHSFGTLIIGKALRRDSKVAYGNVLLCGSILPPDFEWSRYLNAGRVQSVLNHYGGKDLWTRLAVRAIRGSGPSGHIGFVESPGTKDRVFNVRFPDYAHSDFFEGPKYEEHFVSLWRPFFWGKLEQLGHSFDLHEGCKSWKRPAMFLRAPFLTWLIIIILLAAVIAIAV